uniref:Odorant binding protein 12 n=1 Tax=Sirex noctilio TaxID=36765 RepID=A0A857N4Y6_9HYME|nr:odorant binding protein 12 [Sirex noctilio]
MKLVAVLVFVVVISIENVESMTRAQIENGMKIMRKVCQPKFGVSNDILDAAMEGHFPADRALQCYQKCVLGLMKVLKNDKIQLESLLKEIGKILPSDMIERSKEVSIECVPKATSEDACEAAWQFVKCYYETDKTMYIFA